MFNEVRESDGDTSLANTLYHTSGHTFWDGKFIWWLLWWTFFFFKMKKRWKNSAHVFSMPERWVLLFRTHCQGHYSMMFGAAGVGLKNLTLAGLLAEAIICYQLAYIKKVYLIQYKIKIYMFFKKVLFVCKNKTLLKLSRSSLDIHGHALQFKHVFLNLD